MPLTAEERRELITDDIELNGRMRVTGVSKGQDGLLRLQTMKVALPDGQPFRPSNVRDVADSESEIVDVEALIIAIGMRAERPRVEAPGSFYAGDAVTGPSTVVEAVAAGKNAALEIDAWLTVAPPRRPLRKPPSPTSRLPGYREQTSVRCETALLRSGSPFAVSTLRARR